MKYYKYSIDFQEAKEWAMALKYRDQGGGEREM